MDMIHVLKKENDIQFQNAVRHCGVELVYFLMSFDSLQTNLESIGKVSSHI